MAELEEEENTHFKEGSFLGQYIAMTCDAVDHAWATFWRT
jgi:hypothetical protein